MLSKNQIKGSEDSHFNSMIDVEKSQLTKEVRNYIVGLDDIEPLLYSSELT